MTKLKQLTPESAAACAAWLIAHDGDFHSESLESLTDELSEPMSDKDYDQMFRIGYTGAGIDELRSLVVLRPL